MKLKFKHQPFQADAARAVADVFEGQQILAGMSSYKMDVGANMLNLDNDGWKNAPVQPEIQAHLLDRVQKIQKENWITPSQKLEGEGLNLTVEMETGVGKTYTYVKTIHELYKKYGWMKYIVVVPSIAIREGVAKSFKDLEDHFRDDYHVGKSVFVYNSSRLGEIDIFAKDSGIHVMIINAQAFASNFNEERNIEGRSGDKAARIIYTPQDTMGGRKPIDVIAAMNPIIIIDEPQSVEGPATVAALKKFKPLFTLRYSATHRQLFNLVYRLDAVDALRQRLVKKIAVKGITQTGTTGTDGYLFIEAINTYTDKAPDVSLKFDVAGARSVKRTSVKHAGVGFDVFQQSGELAEYDPKLHGAFVISDIDAKLGYVDFRNGLRLFVGEENGNDNCILLRRVQIRETIKSHLEHEERLFAQGIKCLSLFFIDEVSKYRLYGDEGAVPGQYAKIFEEEYERARQDRLTGQLKDLNPEYEAWLAKQGAADCHNGYFSVDNQGHLANPSLERGRGRRNANADEADSNDASAFELIMRGKEKLLSFDDPEGGKIRFIFSHSALREGWDNPNVFQICTLKQSGSYIRKRQEVGRGLRLCVNKFGDRQDQSVLGAGIYDVNTLTVIASESYESFAKDLQRAVVENIGDRPIKVEASLFEGMTYKTSSGDERTVDDKLAGRIYFKMVQNAYVDENGQLTEKYAEDKASGALSLGTGIDVDMPSLVKALDQVFNPSEALPDDDTNASRQEVNYQRLNSAEFQTLWNKINAKSAYTVTFDSDDLVKKAVSALDALRVQKISFEVKTGAMKTDVTKESLANNEAMNLAAGGTYHQGADFNVDGAYKCDLVGEIVSATDLTRKDVAEILAGIQPVVFGQFVVNPEEFIRKASEIINEQKANVIVEHISYDKTSESYTQNIFSEGALKVFPGRRVVKNTTKGVYDKFVLDSEVEENFCKELEAVQDVVVYTKMPKGFYIDTPVGKYNPDWAIVFNAAGQKHVYFVAETKGSVSEFDLNKIEAAKIKCARKHFAAIAPNDIKYEFISTYSDLHAMLTSLAK